jgi:group I intron endonuclease
MGSLASEPLIVVYKATNMVNGHWYVGFTTKGLRHREDQHRYCRSNASLLRNAINKHGQENIVFEVLADFADDEELAKLYEREMIEKYRPEYNLNYGGDGGTTHPDTRRKISEANKGRAPPFKGRAWDTEALKKFRATKLRNGKPAPMTGKKMLPHVREALRKANAGRPSNFKGKKHSDETRLKLSAAAKRRPPRERSEEEKIAWKETIRKANVATRKPVKCVTDGRIFASAREADRFYGFRLGAVTKGVRGECKTVRGRVFERYEDNE